MKPRRACELCGGEAAVHCEADAASLCWACDARVHGANFLVARHLRWVACARCNSLDADRFISGAGRPPVRSICRSCVSSDGPGLSSAASSPVTSCVSTAESAASEEEEEEAASWGVGDGRGRWWAPSLARKGVNGGGLRA